MATIHNTAWNNANGNYTHALNYPLNENSIVVDLGAFQGVWASQIIEKYNPFVYLFEPIPEFYNALVAKFANNPKVKVFNVGVSSQEKTVQLYLNGDGTSQYINQHLSAIEVKLVSPLQLLEMVGGKVDLIQINIEGEEYDLLESMIENNSILSFENIQIQFHDYIENAETRRVGIQNKLFENYTNLFDFPYVFEGWTIKK